MASNASNEIPSTQQLLNRTKRHMRSGDLAKAINCCQEALQIDAKLDWAWSELGDCHHLQGNDERSIECYMRAVEANPRNLKPWVKLGDRYRKRSAPRASLSCYLEATGLDPSGPGDIELKNAARKALDRGNTWARHFLRDLDNPPVTDSHPLVEEARSALESNDFASAILTVTRLFESDVVAPLWLISSFNSLTARLIPNYPRPIIHTFAETAEPVLHQIFAQSRRNGLTHVASSAGHRLYRLLEALGRYDSARQILGMLLEDAREEHHHSEVAQLTNNFAYEFLLEERFSMAEPLFIEARALFERLGHQRDVDNSRANLLTCRFGLLPPGEWREHLAELEEVNAVLSNRRDWRARKTQILLARFFESQRERQDAISWARKAVEASNGIPSQHRSEDQDYLRNLESQ